MGADALGFIFVPDTPRYVGNYAEIEPLLAELPPFVTRVGVCKEPGQVGEQYYRNLDILQVYEHDFCSAYSESGLPLIPAFRVRTSLDLDAVGEVLSRSKPRAVLLDAYHEQQLGGAGIQFDWNLAVEAANRYHPRLILAGGLNDSNVIQAIRQTAPYAVDVASGVEAAPGRKDHEKMRRFINAVRSVG